ncbi:MAG: MBL fold metallo-hydrolase [Candidatus Micrarchaeota archaeon]|nr:MBL fold metallo-hydrolase [Candidatus Micrarchaeota archaeon]
MKVTFFGGAQEVGRSCVLISTGKTKILLDAGIKLGEVEEHPTIKDEELKSIDGIFISHSHLDHIGYLPHIYSAGYRGSIYTTKPTMEFTNVLISDYMHISNPRDVTKEGLNRLQKSYKVCDFRKDVKINDLTVRFLPSGHIVGSSMISVSDGKSTLIYSGDLNLAKTKLLEGADMKGLAAKSLIIESTYGGKNDIFPAEGVVAQKMLKGIKETLSIGGKVIIPSFAVGRAQEILLMLDDYVNSGLLPKVPIYVDGMINKAMRIHRHNVIFCRKELQMRILMSDYDPFKSSNFVPVDSKSQRSKIVNEEESCIIVTTSGMLTGGPVIYYLQKLAGNSTNKVILVGYQAEGTPGRQLQDGVKRIKLDKYNVEVKLSVESHHLSAHADRRQLETMIGKVSGLKNVFIMHGEKSKSEDLRSSISGKYKAIVPRNGESYEI